MRNLKVTHNFNPRSPRGERQKVKCAVTTKELFQSTLSARRATLIKGPLVDIAMAFQSTLSARRATVLEWTSLQSLDNFNPRSPRGERLKSLYKDYLVEIFQSTLSARRATSRLPILRSHGLISIHALREESDVKYYDTMPSFGISIHALREESDERMMRGVNRRIEISIHALREESDVVS